MIIQSPGNKPCPGHLGDTARLAIASYVPNDILVAELLGRVVALT